MATILLVLATLCVIVAVVCTVEHADIIARAARPLHPVIKRSAKKYIKVGATAGLIGTLLTLLRALLQGHPLAEYFALPVLLYKIFFIPGLWLISYVFRSKKKKSS